MDGILLIDKEGGKTSHDVVEIVRRRLGERRVGHTGTLDPLATGLLVLCVGRATRLVEFMEGHDKEYEALFHLGRRTETDDREGATLEEHPIAISREELEERLSRFVGRIRQRPPRYSAVHREGKRLYEYARRGEEVPLPEREVVVHEFLLQEWTPPFARVRVRCSKGTYIRSLARDLGGSVEELRRVAGGPFRIEQATRADGPLSLLPVDAGLADLPRLSLAAEDAARFRQGRWIPVAGADPVTRVYEGDHFVGIGVPAGEGLRPRKVLG